MLSILHEYDLRVRGNLVDLSNSASQCTPDGARSLTWNSRGPTPLSTPKPKSKLPRAWHHYLRRIPTRTCQGPDTIICTVATRSHQTGMFGKALALAKTTLTLCSFEGAVSMVKQKSFWKTFGKIASLPIEKEKMSLIPLLFYIYIFSFSLFFLNFFLSISLPYP
jgi:hypothetical protein